MASHGDEAHHPSQGRPTDDTEPITEEEFPSIGMDIITVTRTLDEESGMYLIEVNHEGIGEDTAIAILTRGIFWLAESEPECPICDAEEEDDDEPPEVTV